MKPYTKNGSSWATNDKFRRGKDRGLFFVIYVFTLAVINGFAAVVLLGQSNG